MARAGRATKGEARGKATRPKRSWAPFVEGAKGQLLMVQWVGYEGVLTPHELYFGAGPAAFGAFAKRRSRLV